MYLASDEIPQDVHIQSSSTMETGAESHWLLRGRRKRAAGNSVGTAPVPPYTHGSTAVVARGPSVARSEGSFFKKGTPPGTKGNQETFSEPVRQRRA